MTRMMTMLTAALAIPALLGCEDATGPDRQGEVEVTVIGDAGASSAASGPSFYRSSGSGAEGTVDVSARVYLLAESGEWVEVTDGTAARTTVNASGGAGSTFARSRVEGRSYGRVRVVFERVEADVSGGLEVGLGSTLVGTVTVDAAGSGGAVVEREIDLEVRSGSSATLTIDLNSDAWLSRASAETRTVSRADFEAAVRVFTS